MEAYTRLVELLLAWQWPSSQKVVDSSARVSWRRPSDRSIALFSGDPIALTINIPGLFGLLIAINASPGCVGR